MVFEIKMNLPLKKFSISRFIAIAGFLTFLYLVEFGIGIRTLYYLFILWRDQSSSEVKKPFVSWTLCMSCLLVSVCSSFIVNIISAVWEQKELKESGKTKNVLRFTFHIIIGGIIWRYIALWFSEKKDSTKRALLLLTMIKFLFTQTFTIPMIIVHISVMKNLEEIFFDISMVLCVSLTLLLTCDIFSCCSTETKDVKKWGFETVNFVPLIFCSDVPNNESTSANSNGEVSAATNADVESQRGNPQGVVLKILVLIQTFGFSLGRLLALGVLLKLAGIYAVSIMFLQLLISVIYLKFQAPILVSEDLPKWRQLIRLAFMSYIMIFEWHLNRDPKTGYCFSSNMKHSMIYYSIATTESIFYLVTWAITVSYSTQSHYTDIKNDNNKFVQDTILIGIVSLMLSLTMHFILLFWNSRRISVFIDSMKRQRVISKMRRSSHKNDDEGKNKMKQIYGDISNPIPLQENVEFFPFPTPGQCNLEKHSSYRDLREPLDDEIEIYVKSAKMADETKTLSPEISDENLEHFSVPTNFQTLEKEQELSQMAAENKKKNDNFRELNFKSDILRQEIHKFEGSTDEVTEAAVLDTSSNTEESHLKRVNASNAKNVHLQDENILKSKVAIISDSMTQKWNNFSARSRKFSNTVREHLQKQKEQIQHFRSKEAGNGTHNKARKCDDGVAKNCDDCISNVPSCFSLERNKSTEQLEKSSDREKTSFKLDKASEEEMTVSEGFFLGDDRCEKLEVQHDVKLSKNEIVHSKEEPKRLDITSTDESTEDCEYTFSEPEHKEGDSTCSCFSCRTLGETKFLRRRSLSMPTSDRKPESHAETVGAQSERSSNCFSSPTNIRKDISNDKDKQDLLVIRRIHKVHDFKNMSLASLDGRVEHYV